MQSKKKNHALNEYFSGCLYFTAGKMFRTVDRLAAESFKKLSLAPTHAFLIMALFESPQQSATPSHLADVLNLDRSTVTRLISSLEKKKIVERTRSGRMITVQLLGKGAEMLPEIQECWKDLYRRYCAEFGKNRAESVNQLIVKALIKK